MISTVRTKYEHTIALTRAFACDSGVVAAASSAYSAAKVNPQDIDALGALLLDLIDDGFDAILGSDVSCNAAE